MNEDELPVRLIQAISDALGAAGSMGWELHWMLGFTLSGIILTQTEETAEERRTHRQPSTRDWHLAPAVVLSALLLHDRNLPPADRSTDPMLTTANTSRRRLLMRVSAAAMLLMLVGFTVLMQSMAGTASSAEYSLAVPMNITAQQHLSDPGRAVHSATQGSPTSALLSDTGCGRLCGVMCSLLDMACVLTIALFAWALLRPRAGGILNIFARLLALADRVARRVAVPKPRSLSELQIIRI